MIRHALATACLIGLIGPAVAQSEPGAGNWTTYRNERFGFSLSYPGDVFEVERTSEAGDGVVLRAPDSDARLLAGALINSDRHTLASYQQFVARKSYADYRITYQPRGSSWFVLSGRSDDKIFYEKVVFSCAGRLINSFALVYPADRRDTFDRIVERVESSFSAGTKECAQGAGTEHMRQPKVAASRAPDRSRQAHHPRSAMADRIARTRGHDVLVIMRRVQPPYDYKVVRGYASR